MDTHIFHNYTRRDDLKRHLDVHDLKENGLKFICKKCQNLFSSRGTFRAHARKQHKGLRFEPELVIDDTKKNNQEVSFKQQQSSMAKLNPKESRPRKGKWIVKLVRIDVHNFNAT